MQPFQLERYFARYEFSVPHLLSPSDIEPLTVPDLLAWASPERHQQWETLHLGYTESQGHHDLRQLISQLYTSIAPHQVIEVVPEEGIFITMMTLLAADDHIIVMHPGYQSLYEIASSRGVEVGFWQPDHRWQFDMTELETLLTPKTKMLVVNTPHNPTGSHFDSDQWEHMLAFAAQHDLWLFADEMYRHSEYLDEDRLDAACDRYAKAISLSGLSKSFALPGLRVGWLSTQSAEAMQQFITYKDYTTICGSAPSEILAMIALEAREEIFERNLAIIRNNLEVLDRFFEAYAEQVSWVRPRAGTVALVEHRGSQSIQALADDLVAQRGLMILPATVFDLDGDYFRLGFGRRNLPQTLQHFADYLDDTLRD